MREAESEENEEKEEKGGASSQTGYGMWIIIALICGGMVIFGPVQYRTISLIGIGCLVLFFLFSLAKGKKPVQSAALVIAIIVIVIAAIFAYPYAAPVVKPYYDYAYKSISNLIGQGKSGGGDLAWNCLSGSEECDKAFSFDTKTEQNLGGSIIKVDTTKLTYGQNPFWLNVPITVKSNTPLKLQFSCSADNTPAIMSPETLEFEKDIQSTKGLSCSGEGRAKKASIKVESTLSNVLNIPISIGKEGDIQTAVNYIQQGPYNIKATTAGAQPFSEDEPLIITFEKLSSSDFKLSKISSFKVLETNDENMKIVCPEVKGDSKDLSENSHDNKYSINCEITILNIPSAAKTSYAKIETEYYIESEYNITLK